MKKNHLMTFYTTIETVYVIKENDLNKRLGQSDQNCVLNSFKSY